MRNFSLEKGSKLCNGKYKVEREINRGGTSIVYEAIDLDSNNKVALKVMNMPSNNVKKEVECASSISHRNVVELLDVFAEKQNLVIVWELVQGLDLLDLLLECGGRISESMAFKYFIQLLDGVLFLHKNGLCHRDLKLENCMIKKMTHELKIIDFGLSKHLDSAVTLGVGTPDYMAPELLINISGRKGSYDARAIDVWAMGVILYIMVSGRYPFENPQHPDNVSFTLANVRKGKYRKLPSDVSASCTDLIDKMLTKKANNRITLANISRHAWMKQKRIELPGHADTKRGILYLNGWVDGYFLTIF